MTDAAELDELIAEITVDCDDEEERLSSLLSVFTDEITFPLEAAVLDITVLVLDVDMRESELTARCRHGSAEGEIALADLVFPAHTVAAWLHAVYRRFLGLTPRPATKPEGWNLSWQ